MAISSPLAPSLPSLISTATPVAPVAQDPALAVTPTTGAERGGSSDTTTSEQARQAAGRPADDAIEEINATMHAWATNLRFEIDPDAQRLVVSVVDTDSGEVLRTVPNEAAIRIAKMVVSLQGNMVDTSA